MTDPVPPALAKIVPECTCGSFLHREAINAKRRARRARVRALPDPDWSVAP